MLVVLRRRWVVTCGEKSKWSREERLERETTEALCGA
jgi:hypothetical protein